MNRELTDLIRSAGRMVLNAGHISVEQKEGHANFVTETDRAVQDYLIEGLSRVFPEAVFFAEEKDDNVLTDKPTFIIDPIDGTTNFFRRRRMSSISIGLCEHCKPVLALTYNPYTDELFTAEKGKGAFCGDTRLHVSDYPPERSLIEFGSAPYYSELAEVTARSIYHLLTDFGDVRRTGSAVIDLMNVAAGLSEGTFEWHLKPWDFCAGSLIVEEAGGRTGRIEGGDLTYEAGQSVMTANPRCFDALRECLLKAKL